MMKDQIQALISKMPAFNLELKDPQLIADCTWLDLSNSTSKMKRVYIFRGLRHEWLVANNGAISTGEWDYFPNTHSLLMVYGDRSTLYNTLLVDSHYLVLKQDAYKEGILLVNQAYYISLVQELGAKGAIQRVFQELKALAIDTWVGKGDKEPALKQKDVNNAPKEKPSVERKQPQAAEETAYRPKEAIVKQESTAVNDLKNVVEGEQEEERREGGIEEARPALRQIDASEEEKSAAMPSSLDDEASDSIEEAERPRETSILDRYRQEAKEEMGEEEEKGALGLEVSKHTSLNDRLKSQLKRNEQPTLLDRLKEQRK